MIIESTPFLSKGRVFNLRRRGNRVVVEGVPRGNIFIAVNTLCRDTSVNETLDFKFDDSYRIRDLRKK